MLSAKPAFNDIVGAILATIGLAVIAYLAIAYQSEQAEGALIALLSAAIGYIYRGRVQSPPETPPGNSGAP